MRQFLCFILFCGFCLLWVRLLYVLGCKVRCSIDHQISLLDIWCVLLNLVRRISRRLSKEQLYSQHYLILVQVHLLTNLLDGSWKQIINHFCRILLFVLALVMIALKRMLVNGWQDNNVQHFLLFIMAYVVYCNISGTVWDCSALLCALGFGLVYQPQKIEK